jgi:hypothetical protein
MSNIILFDPSDQAIVTFDWSDVLTGSVTVSSATHTVPSPLTKVTESTATPYSSIKISGAVHGGRYMVEGQATLSNGEVLNRQFEIKGWNS